MAGVYKVSEKELRFLFMFSEKQGLQGMGDTPLIETQTEAQECVKSLCEKGYLRFNQRKEYEIDSTLELILTVAERPYGYSIMEDLRQSDIVQKAAFYFLNDVIAIVEQKDKDYELVWIPYLPLAIGEIANLHTPFLNKKTVTVNEADVEEAASYIDEYLKSGFKWQWEIWGKQKEDAEKAFSMFVLSDGNEQVMVKEADDKIFMFKPDKADYVNAITEWLACVHGGAIKKMLQEA